MSEVVTKTKTTGPTQTLQDAVDQCFRAVISPDDFAKRLVTLTAALTTSQTVYVLTGSGEGLDVIAGTTPARPSDGALELAAEILGSAKPELKLEAPHLATPISLPGKSSGALIIKLPSGGGIAHSLAYERLTFLSTLSRGLYAHPDLSLQTQLLKQIEGGQSDTQAIADGLCRLTDADYVAIAPYDGTDIGEVTISGQANITKRAALPAALRQDMAETASRRYNSAERSFSHGSGTGDGIVVHIDSPRRNHDLAPLFTSALSTKAAPPALSRSRLKRFAKPALVAAIIGVLGFIPIPDGLDIPSEIEAKNRRMITAPFSAVLASVEVTDNQRVIAGETVLARLDTSEVDLDLIAAQAEYARALLERETARAGRNAADLKNAELEAERIRARIDLLELEKSGAELLAPISGIVVGQGLRDRIGSTVRQGDPLLEVADPSNLRLSLSIPETVIGQLDGGASGLFRPDFDPTRRIDATVAQISPAASDTQTVSVFTGKAELSGDTSALSPGMKGVLAVDRDMRPIWSIVYTSLRDWMLLRLWI
jgi:multidrug resistance efflux pump